MRNNASGKVKIDSDGGEREREREFVSGNGIVSSYQEYILM